MRRTIIISIALIILLSIVLYGYFNSIRREYHNRLKEENQKEFADLIYTKSKIPTQYLEYLKITNTHNISLNSFELSLSGEIKLSPEEEFAKGKVTQETFLDNGVRLFLMKLKYKGLNVYGIHDYNKDYAKMKIKVLDLITVVNQEDETMHRAETVTYLNDLCIFAPQALLYEDVSFEEIDSHRIKVTLTKHGQTVSAELVFDDEYKVINFISNDRTHYSDGKYIEATWSTPITEYKRQGDYYLPYKGSAVWTINDEEFEYFKLTVDKVTYK